MSEIIESLPGRAHRYMEHPYDTWADGQARLLRRGQDYFGTDQSMIRMLRRAAAVRGMGAIVRRAPEGLAVQFVGKP